MNKIWSALAVIGFAGITVANAQTIIYAPERSIADQHISLRGWGSGTIAQTDEMAYSGTNSIRVSSRNFFQGGIVTFGAPVDLSQQFNDRANLLRITFQAPDATTTMGGGPGRGGPGGNEIGGVASPVGGKGTVSGAGAGAGGGPGGATGGQNGGKGIGGRGNTPGTGTTMPPQPPLSMVRMIITTTDGKKSEVYVSVTTSGKGERGWKQVAIPLSGITNFDKTNKTIKEIALAGDSISTFYIGDLRVINDTTPITGEARIDRTNMALGDTGTLTAYGNGGSSVLKYEWDFDSDGKVDSEGQFVKHKFRTKGDYTITLTVSDVYGLKKPYQTKLQVHVNP